MITLAVMYLNVQAPKVELYELGDDCRLQVGYSGDLLGLWRGAVCEAVWAGNPSDVEAVWAEIVSGLRAGNSVIALNLRSLGRGDVVD